MPEKYPTESERQRVVLDMLRVLLGSTVEPFTIPIHGGRSATTDGGLVMDVGSSNVLLFIAEFKNEVDSGCGDPLFQLMRSFELYLGSPLFDSEIRSRDACPALAMEVVGPALRISAIASLDGNNVMAEPLTPFLHFLPVVGQRPYLDGLVAVLRAFRDAVRELRDHYKALHATYPRDLAPVASVDRDPAIALPYPLRDAALFADVEAHCPGKLVYAATHVPTGKRVCVKFTTHQSAACLAVQRAWAAAKLAPAVVVNIALPGAFDMHVMELLAPADGWEALACLPDPDRSAALACAEQALKCAHALDVDSGAGSSYRAAHGDCRGNNVLVRRRQAGAQKLPEFDVNFVDFDWAGPAGEQRYPAYMSSRRVIPWPAAAFPGASLQQSHDLELLKTQYGSTRVWSARAAPPSARLHVVAGAFLRVPTPTRGRLMGVQRVVVFGKTC